MAVGLYAFYNWNVSKQGEPFRMCDECAKKQPIPPTCYLNKLADNASGECTADWHDRRTSKEEK